MAEENSPAPGEIQEKFPDGDLAVQPHDAFFKKIFSNPAHAARFFKSHLPPSLVQSADWPGLRHLPGSFVKPGLGQLHSDLLFSLKTGKRETLVHLLFEHQSQPDEKMPLRLFGYIREILDSHHDRHGYPLPAVLPVVVNQGPAQWRHPVSFGDLFDLPGEAAGELARFVPKFDYILLDLARHDPEREEGDEFNRIVLGLMRAARVGAQVEFLRRLVKNLTGGELESVRPAIMTSEVFGEMVVYVLTVTKDLDAGKLLDIVSEDTQAEQIAMTAADQLIQKGIQKGIRKGIQEGIQEGIRRGSLIGQIRTTAKYLGEVPEEKDAPLESLGIAELEALAGKLENRYARRFRNR